MNSKKAKKLQILLYPDKYVHELDNYFVILDLDKKDWMTPYNWQQLNSYLNIGQKIGGFYTLPGVVNFLIYKK